MLMWNTCSPVLNFPRKWNDQVYFSSVPLVLSTPSIKHLNNNVFNYSYFILFLLRSHCVWFMVTCKKGWKGCLGCVAQGVLFISSSVLWFIILTLSLCICTGTEEYMIVVQWITSLNGPLIFHNRNVLCGLKWICIFYRNWSIGKGITMIIGCGVEEELMQHSIAFRSWKIWKLISTDGLMSGGKLVPP